MNNSYWILELDSVSAHKSREPKHKKQNDVFTAKDNTDWQGKEPRTENEISSEEQREEGKRARQAPWL